MEILVRVKNTEKKKDILAPTQYTIPDGLSSLRQLLTAIVHTEVDRYNSKEAKPQLIPLLTPQELDAQAKTGKVGFGALFSDRKPSPPKAVATALQCWEDGLVRVFMNDEELCELDGPISIPENAVFTFIRLSFLSGSIW